MLCAEEIACKIITEKLPFLIDTSNMVEWAAAYIHASTYTRITKYQTMFIIIFINLTQHFTGYITCKHIYFEIFFSWYYDAKGEFIDMHTCRALQKQMLAQ